MSLELGKLNQGMVTQAVPLARLVANPTAQGTTRTGDPYSYDPAAVKALAAKVPPWLHGRLRLPITVYEPHDASGDGYVEDATAVEALEAMKVATTTPRAGRLWMSTALWHRTMDQYPTCFQRVHV